MSNKLDTKTDVSTVVGNSLYIKYGKDLYSIKMEDKAEYDYSTPEGAIEALNKQLEKVNIGSGSNKETLADVMEAKYDDSTKRVTFQLKKIQPMATASCWPVVPVISCRIWDS